MQTLYGWAFSDDFVTEDMRIQVINADGIIKLSPDLRKIEAIAFEVGKTWKKTVIIFSVIGKFSPEIRYEAVEE